MQAPTYDLQFDLGSDDSAIYQLTLDGTAIDLTGATVTQEIRCTPGATVKATLSTGNSGITLTDAANGIFTVTYTKATLEALGAGSFSYDIFTTIGGLEVMRVRGRINVANRVTVIQ